MDIKQIKFKDFTCNVVKFYYLNNRTAIRLVDCEDGMPVLTATVNLPEHDIEEDEVLIKSWSENEGIEELLVNENVIGPKIKEIPAGFATATLHKLLI